MPEATARETPLDYGDAAAEYDAVRRHVGVIDRADRGLIEATGRDRASFLHALLSTKCLVISGADRVEHADLLGLRHDLRLGDILLQNLAT